MARKVGLNGIDLSNQRIQNLASGTNPADAVNLAQMQAALNGLSWHGAVRVASTTNINVSSPGTTIDGVTLAVGDRVLLKNQTTGSQNGIYVFQGSTSAMTLAPDGIQGELTANATTYAAEGTVNADTAWTLTTNNPITVGTTALTFAQVGGGQSYTAGTGILLNGTVFSLDTSIAARKFAANVGDGSSTTITVAHNLGTLDVTAQLVLVSTGETVDTDTVRTTTNAVAFTFAAAPALGAYRAVITG